MYSKNTLRKMTQAVKERMAIYQALKSYEYKTCISTGNDKIGKVMNVSLAPIITCRNCKECSGFCYDVKAVLFRKQVLDARARNTVKAMFHRDDYFNDIIKRIERRRKNKYFRWHVGGDIPDYDYFKRMVQIAKDHPDFLFWTYTKMYWIVNAYCDRYGRADIPQNLIIMFSKWDGLKMENPYNFPEFHCKLKAGNKDTTLEQFEKMHKCPGNCDICKITGRGCIAGETTYADEH